MVLVLYPAATTYLVLCALFRPWLKMLCQSDIAVPCIALASCDALLVGGCMAFTNSNQLTSCSICFQIHTLKMSCI